MKTKTLKVTLPSIIKWQRLQDESLRLDKDVRNAEIEMNRATRAYAKAQNATVKKKRKEVYVDYDGNNYQGKIYIHYRVSGLTFPILRGMGNAGWYNLHSLSYQDAHRFSKKWKNLKTAKAKAKTFNEELAELMKKHGVTNA